MGKDTTDYKQLAFKLQSDIEEGRWLNADMDLKFLQEIKQKLEDSRDKKDPTLFEYALNMIDDWINELKEIIER